MCLVWLPFTVCLCDPGAAAVDLWSVGVILLCILSGRYPFFRAQDDLTAFIQIMRLMGTVACKEAAKALGEHSWEGRSCTYNLVRKCACVRVCEETVYGSSSANAVRHPGKCILGIPLLTMTSWWVNWEYSISLFVVHYCCLLVM